MDTPNRCLNHERIGWITCTILVVIPFVWLRELGFAWIGWVLGAVFVIALLGSIVTSNARRDVGNCDGKELTALRKSINDYCRQLAARRRQRPWLVVSLLCALSGYVMWAQSEGIVALRWIAVASCWLSSFSAMIIAGAVAEDNPAEEGREDVKEAVQIYKDELDKKKLNSAAAKKMLQKITDKRWYMEDLLDFVIEEEVTARRGSNRQFSR
jgi:hypothetical protein